MSIKTLISNQLVKLAEKVRKAPIIEREFAITEESIYHRYKLAVYSPDELVTRKRFEIFDEMMKDSQIKSCVDGLKEMRLSTGWEIKPKSDDPIDKEIAKFVEYNLNNVEGTFYDDLFEIMSAIESGWSLNEKVWTIGDKTSLYPGRILLKSIKSLNPKYFNIGLDDFKNIEDNGVISLTIPAYGVKYPKDKFIIYSYRKRYEGVFGTSILRPLYDLWYLKTIIKRAMGVYLEKYGIPPVVGKYPPTMSKTEQDDLFEMLKQLRLESVGIVPQEVVMEFLNPQGRGIDNFLRAIEYIDEQITKTIFGETLTSDYKESGSYALGKIHFNILLMRLEYLGNDVTQKAIMPQLIDQIVHYNYPERVELPIFQFKPLVKEDVKENIDRYLSAMQQGAVTPIPEEDERFIRDALGLPQRKKEIPSESIKTSIVSVMVPEKTPEQIPQAIIGTPPVSVWKPVSQETKKFIEFQEKRNRRLFTGVTRKTFTKFEEVVDFEEVLDTIETIGVNKYVPEISNIIQMGKNKLFNTIRDIVENKDIDQIEQLTFEYTGDIKRQYQDMTKRAFELGVQHARKEIRNAHLKKFQDEPLVDIRPIVPEEAIALLEQESFKWAGIDRDYILNTVKTHLIRAMEHGWTLKDIVNDIENALKPYFEQGLVGEEALRGYRIETKVRTYFTKAYNMGRIQFFTAPEQRDFVKAFQYSAILDDRVRPSHAALDSLIYSITDDIWDLIKPPNGYNCRCLLVPVTAVDEWEPSPKPPMRVLTQIENEKSKMR